jgi:hypothetical protein
MFFADEKRFSTAWQLARCRASNAQDDKAGRAN